MIDPACEQAASRREQGQSTNGTAKTRPATWVKNPQQAIRKRRPQRVHGEPGAPDHRRPARTDTPSVPLVDVA